MDRAWSWDITYLKSPVRGSFYYLYLVVDVWSRKIVGWKVHECESPELAKLLIEEAVQREGADAGRLVLHSDNGGPMKGKDLWKNAAADKFVTHTMGAANRTPVGRIRG